jgi:hypothetical protein
VIPGERWGATWLLAIAVALGLTFVAERAARKMGQRPSVVDDPVSWAVPRRTVDNDRNVVAFIGTSRMLLAYSSEAFRAAAPDARGLQLAINGVPAIGVLEDLAADETFRGVAVVDLDEWDVAWGDPVRGAKEYVERSHALWRAPGALANRWLAGFAQERVALLALGGRPVVTTLARGKPPAPTLVAAARDRTSVGMYSLAEPGALEVKARNRLSNFAGPPPAPQDWVTRALAIEPLVQRIRARGGDVLIVRMPISGRLAAGFDEHYPRTQYWDAFAAKSRAHVVHFHDIPALRDLQCPDEMHIDGKDRATFTRAIVDELRARRVLPR